MKNNVRRMTYCAVLIAAYFLLSLFEIKLWNFRITLKALPVLLSGMLFGPVPGLIVGGMGEFIAQLLSEYGLTATTLLWILPHAASGFVVGLLSKAIKYDFTFLKVAVIDIISALLVTLLNTFAMYVDSKMFGYYSKAFVFGALGLKIVTGILTAVVFAAILPSLIKALQPFVQRGNTPANP